MKRPLKMRKLYLYLFLIVVVLGFILTMVLSKVEVEEREDLQLGAIERMENAEAYLKECIIERGIDVEEADLNRTYLIGPEFTELTSTPGEEGAKRSTLNPEFASVLVRYFLQAGLEKGDKIAVGTSGSFPGFVIAVLTAATEMELDVDVIASVGASMHGGTRVEYNIFNILEDLKNGGFCNFNLIGVSCGGKNDNGGSVLEGILYEGTPELSLELCREASERTGAKLIYHKELKDSIKERLELFGDDVDLFVNIGGASTNNGTSAYTLDFPPGLVMSFPSIPEGDERGLNFEYAARGVPVINLLSVKELCRDNGLAFDPIPLPKAENAKVSSKVEYNPWIIIVTLVLAFSVLIVGFVDSYRRGKGGKR